MNMKKRIMSMALVGIMILSGCKKGGEEKPENDVVQDLGGDIVLKVGESEMTDNQFQFFLDDIKNQMQGTELSTEESWENAEIDGKKAIEVAKERAYDIAVDYLSGIELGKKLGMECTQEEIDSSKSQINTSYFDKYTDGESIIDLMCEAEIYLGKIQQKFLEENALTEEEKEKYFNEHKDEFASQYLRAKHVLILTQNEETKESLPEAEKAEKKKKADEILARAKNGEDFDALVKEFSEDPGSQSQPDGYVFTSGEMVPEFENCVRGLGMDEIGFTETSYGYHIIKRLDLDLVSCKSLIESSIYSEKFVTYMEEKIDEYKIEAVKNDEEYNAIK